MEKPVIWKMIEEAIENLSISISYTDIKEYINGKWGNVKSTSIDADIIAMTVNHNSRIHYKGNYKPRLTNSNSPYDLLYSTGRGQVVKYNVEEHGIWEIYEDENGKRGVRLCIKNASPNTYLFVWNPNKWNWKELEQNIDHLENGGNVTENWSCSSHKAVKVGDRAFLTRVGSEPRGIFASGYIVKEPFYSEFRSGEDKAVPRMRVVLDFDVLLNPNKEPILTNDILNVGALAKQQWTPQASGISIKSELVDELEAVWFNFLATQNTPFRQSNTEAGNKFIEGTASQVIQTRYERNPYARAACIKHFGYKCSVCEFDFEKQYGTIGTKFIHVHHLTKVATIGKTYEVDPIKDLCPVCPNCHAMLHRQEPPLTIENLKNLLRVMSE